MAATMRARAFVLFLVLLAPAFAGCAELTEKVQSGLGELKNNYTKPGDNAVDLLSNKKYSRLVIELDYVPGNAPEKQTEQWLLDTFAQYTDKSPEATQIVRSGDLPARGSNYKYRLEEIAELEKEHRDHFASGDTVALYVMFVDGGFEQDVDSENRYTLGAAYHGTSLVMFKANLKKASGGGVLSFRCPISDVEPRVMRHELGHVFGLVNNGIPMQRDHEDPDHPGHSVSKDSIMYWALENSGDLFTLFGSCSSIPDDFDADDKADMRAARGG